MTIAGVVDVFQKWKWKLKKGEERGAKRRADKDAYNSDEQEPNEMLAAAMFTYGNFGTIAKKIITIVERVVSANDLSRLASQTLQR